MSLFERDPLRYLHRRRGADDDRFDALLAGVNSGSSSPRHYARRGAVRCITAGKRLAGVVADGEVTVVAATPNGESSLTLVYRTDAGELGERIITTDTLETITKTEGRRWTFDANGAHFRLASEARRMKWAHLADPFAAVDTSNIEPYPHQIEAVHEKFLPQRPLR